MFRLTLLAAFALQVTLGDATKVLPIRNIFTFPINTFVENIAVRSNSHLIVASPSVPTLFTIDPSAPSPDASVAHTFPEGTGPWGITEITSDKFVVVTGIWDFANTRALLGSLTVWTVNFGTSPPTVKNITRIANSTIFNGIAAVPGSTKLILAADSDIGAVWRVNINSGAYSIAFSDPLFANTATGILGINGIRIKGGYLYFTNSAQGIFGRVPIDGEGSKIGAAEVIANVPSGVVYDDFAIDDGGNTWIASHPNEVVEVTPNGNQRIITNTTLLLNPTNSVFGRGNLKERKTLYVTNGGWFVGNDLVNGSVVAIST